MTAQDFVQADASVFEIRKALTETKEARKAMCEGSRAIKRAVLALGSGGRICGQCKAFKPLGNVAGLNGTCHTVSRNTYTLPESPACHFFIQKEEQ
jgi:hypothetical protein